MIFLAILLSLGAGAAYWAARREAEKHGDTVAERRWERSLSYRPEEFIGWVTSGASSLDGYARVLAPYDIAFLFCLSGALAAWSLAAADALHLAPDSRWMLALAPAAYCAADLAEDRLLLRLIGARAATMGDIGRLKRATALKIATVVLAVAQTIGLLIWRLAAHAA